jgi:uncharacterized protein (TIGR03067 family)
MAGSHVSKGLGYFSLVVGLVFNGPAMAVQPQNGATEKPAAAAGKMEGDWKATAATHAGIELGGPFLTNMTLKIKGDQFDLQAGPLKEKGKAEFTPDAKPVKLKLTATDGNNKGKNLLAICEQSGPDQLKICYTLKGKEYPKAFESTEDNKALLITYERVK